MENIFIELGLGIFIASIFGIIAKLLKQPLVIAYIFTGFVIAPFLFGSQGSREIISIFSTTGIAFLLFMVGIELKVEKILEAGKKILLIGFLQIFFTALLGYFLSILLGFNSTVSLYIGIVFSFSSTVIVVNLLSEKKALSSLYGRIAISILILQDVFALLVLVFLSGMKDGSDFSFLEMGQIFVKGFFIFLLVYLFSKLVIKKVFKYLAHSLDLLFLSSIAWCFAIAGLAKFLGFSVEMGAFLAGLSLASLPYSEEISLKLSPLRDFFLILFFITLGMQTNWDSIGGFLVPIIILSLFIIFIKSLIIMILMSYYKFTKRTSFYSAMSLAQISEFSIIIAGVGLGLSHFGKDIFSLITIITIITILISSYIITFLGHIYNIAQKQLKIFEKEIEEEQDRVPKYKNHIVLFGYHRLGKQLFHTLEKISKKIIVVDIDPEVVDDLSCKGRTCVYGDAYDVELLEKVNIEKAKMVVVTFPAFKSNKFLIKKIKSLNKKIKIITTAEEIQEALELYKLGADYVILPHYLGGEHVVGMLNDINKKKKSLGNIRKYHIASLKEM